MSIPPTNYIRVSDKATWRRVFQDQSNVYTRSLCFTLEKDQ